MRYIATILFFTLVSACSSQAKYPGEDPATCIAAFLWTVDHIKGTALQADPQAAELRLRILYEQSRTVNLESIDQVERRVLLIGRNFSQDAAIGSAKKCLVAQEAGGEYRRQRPKLIAALRAAH